MTYVSLEDICVSYDRKTNILENLNIRMEKGELVSLLGPSGCGKTTTLRVIAGLIEPNSGKFVVDEREMTRVSAHKRNFGLVFQSYALFPHLTVFENVAFGLKLRKMDKSRITAKVSEMLKITDLEALRDRFPKQLSGGQRQRVALARALVIEPKLLLLDEPLSNLDAKLRINMRVEIRSIQRKLGITTVFVTHDQEECFSISDKVAVMNKGIIEQYDTPEFIYNNPSTEFVARFIGFENFIQLSRVRENEYKANDGSLFNVEKAPIKEARLGTIRPADIAILRSDEITEANIVKGNVKVRTFLGKAYQYDVETELGKLVVTNSCERVYNPGDTITLFLPENKILLV